MERNQTPQDERVAIEDFLALDEPVYITGDLDNVVQTVCDEVEEIMKEKGYDQERVYDVLTAISEIVDNARKEHQRLDIELFPSVKIWETLDQIVFAIGNITNRISLPTRKIIEEEAERIRHDVKRAEQSIPIPDGGRGLHCADHYSDGILLNGNPGEYMEVYLLFEKS